MQAEAASYSVGFGLFSLGRKVRMGAIGLPMAMEFDGSVMICGSCASGEATGFAVQPKSQMGVVESARREAQPRFGGMEVKVRW